LSVQSEGEYFLGKRLSPLCPFYARFWIGESMPIKRVLLLFIFALLPSIALSNDLWELEKDSDGIKVYTQLEAGSPYKSFKAITVTNANSQAIAGILEDVKGYVTWFAFTEKVDLLENSLHEKYVYMETRYPWPFNNGDMIYKMTFATEGKTITKVTLVGVPDYLPPVAGITRMKEANGYILLTPVGNKTEITYYMHSDIGGEIPVWMANKYIDNLPYQTLSRLNNIVNAPQSLTH
jgi:hypothetical protein